MKITRILGALALGAMMATGTASAASWTLDAEASLVSFGSVKKDRVGEVHSFESISGSVDDAGMVTIDIDLASVQTGIAIRNERMVEHVFGGMGHGMLQAQIDAASLSELAVGDTTVLDLEANLHLLGADIPVTTEMFVARLGEGRVMVTTNSMVFLSMEKAGVNDGITKLMELAKLPGITRTSPVTLRLIFDQDM